MSSQKKTALFAGILIISGIIFGIFSVVPAVEGTDYLTETFANKNQVLRGAFFQFFLVPIYLGFALLLYPHLKKYKANLGIGFLAFRIMAAIFQLVGVILLPLFLYLSQAYLATSRADTVHFEALGEMLKLSRDLVNHLGVMLATGMGNLILYYVLYKTKFIPKWLSIWGLIANTLAMLTSFLILFDYIDVISASFAIMTIPLVLQEIVLSVVFIAKGLGKTKA